MPMLTVIWKHAQGPSNAEVMNQRFSEKESGVSISTRMKQLEEQRFKKRRVKCGADIATVKHILSEKGKKALTPSQKGLYKATVCDAVWTKARLEDAGYEVGDVKCARCKKSTTEKRKILDNEAPRRME